MTRRTIILTALAACVLCVLPVLPARASAPGIAVASNFQRPARALARAFEVSSGQRIALSFGSTGRHYAQILHGAPFAAFLAADAKRPRKLEAAGKIVPGSRFTYAIGRLVLFSPRPGYVDAQGAILKNGTFKRLAIANPRLAPYGRAAKETLQKLGLWEALAPRLVRGENIGQTYQFIISGAAELGFAAASQAARPGAPAKGSLWRVPENLHAPIIQQAVLLRDDKTARAFLAFLRSPRGRAIIASYGYATPK